MFFLQIHVFLRISTLENEILFLLFGVCNSFNVISLFFMAKWETLRTHLYNLIQIIFFFIISPSVNGHKKRKPAAKRSIHSRIDIDIDDNAFTCFRFSPFSLFFCSSNVPNVFHFPIVCFFLARRLSNQLIYMFTCCLLFFLNVFLCLLTIHLT